MCKKRFLSLVFVVAAMLSLTAAASAAQPEAVSAEAASVSFTGLDHLSEGEKAEYRTVDASGSEVAVSLEKIAAAGLADRIERGVITSETWKVSYDSFAIKAEFYMTVSNNRVTSVYDDWISITGGTYSNVSLTKTNTYGKLSFDIRSIAGLVSGSCWLKGEVTGSDDQITITWEM